MTSDNKWIDPLYLTDLLTNEEKAIKQFNRYQNFGDYGYIKERLKIN